MAFECHTWTNLGGNFCLRSKSKASTRCLWKIELGSSFFLAFGLVFSASHRYIRERCIKIYFLLAALCCMTSWYLSLLWTSPVFSHSHWLFFFFVEDRLRMILTSWQTGLASENVFWSPVGWRVAHFVDTQLTIFISHPCLNVHSHQHRRARFLSSGREP